MGKRSEWTFTYAMADIAAATEVRRAYHQSRLEDWGGRLKAAEEDLKENGIDFREVAKRSSLANSGYRQQPQFDPVKLAVLEEAQGKVDQHERLVAEYARYLRAFAHAMRREQGRPTLGLALSPDDLEFFGL